MADGKKKMADVLVVIPGILGSVLQRNGEDVWALSGSALWRSLFDMSLPKRIVE